MSRSKKKVYKPDLYACKGGEHETFAMIYDSMLKEEKFKRLSTTAKFLYIICRNQMTCNAGKQTLYNHAKEFGVTYQDNCFVLPAKHQREYGLNDRSNVRRGMKELEEAGFIKKLENNAARWKTNVYRFSDEWKSK